jgi:hypothetical protein
VTRYGYFLFSEEYDPAELVRQARLAETVGFEALSISDHFHPWTDDQGQSSFVWSVIGAISQVTSLPITTAVTCPIMRVHPAIVAQAAAAAGLLTGGRFNLGLGSGQALNEHIMGQRWPGATERLEMLEESRGTDQGPVHRRPGQSPRPVLHRRDGPPVLGLRPAPADLHLGLRHAVRAARREDRRRLHDRNAGRRPGPLYRESGGGDRPVQGGLKVCWGPDVGQARKAMHRLWPSEEIPGEAAQLLPLPRHFEQLSELVAEEIVSSPCWPDPGAHAAGLRQFADAGELFR